MGVGGVVVLLSLAFAFAMPRFAPGTERELVRCFQANRATADGLLYFQKRKFSAEFYTCGQAATTTSLEELLRRMQGPGRVFLAIDVRNFDLLPAAVQARFKGMGRWGKQSALYEQCDALSQLTVDPP